MNGTIGTSGMGTLGILLGNDDNGALIIRDLDSSSPNSASVLVAPRRCCPGRPSRGLEYSTSRKLLRCIICT